jgi:hypothetical protein
LLPNTKTNHIADADDLYFYAADYTGTDLFACTNNYQEPLSLFSYVNML